MNKYILLVMKWLNDKDSVTQEELLTNRASAHDTTDYAAAADYYTYAAEKWVNKYFERTNENKQDYIDTLNVTTKPVYTQAMDDNGVLPSVGMQCTFKHGGYDCDGVVTAITKEYIVLTEKSGKERIRKSSESPIKPLDTRTTEQKQLDDIFKCLPACIKIHSDRRAAAKLTLKAIKSGKITGVSFNE